MATSYRPLATTARNDKDDSPQHNLPIPGDVRPNPAGGERKLLDQYRDRIRALHYARATEKAYHHWIVEFLQFHRAGDE